MLRLLPLTTVDSFFRRPSGRAETSESSRSGSARSSRSTLLVARRLLIVCKIAVLGRRSRGSESVA